MWLNPSVRVKKSMAGLIHVKGVLVPINNNLKKNDNLETGVLV